MPGSAFCTTAECLALPAVDSAGQAGYADAWLNLIGVLSQATQQVNYDRSGVAQQPGTAVVRKFGFDEYEIYGQDAWRPGPNVTVNCTAPTVFCHRFAPEMAARGKGGTHAPRGIRSG